MLGGVMQLDDAYLGGERNSAKAGQGSENKRPFAITVETTQDGRLQQAVIDPADFTKPSADLGVQSRSVMESVNPAPHSRRDYGPDTPWQGHDYARHPSGNTAIEGSAQRASGEVWPQPEDGRRSASANSSRRASRFSSHSKI
ncbi:hypothetical protein FHS81_003411 [Pseudochelatococcus contaminans]|jgi:hypothetical protein|uniref:Uncharacterized protein n=1 Tax=Pseudochelatococcus contaminans TaxID=1538103 RepID=A0A7W6EIZ9_9HYPH|nr:hypothetical protein [Pseudochelatococcus contaminans]|tara:strand:- start:484 stop:912 length:429 start_codon:yes stop_codon:yes gene_type:complete